MDADDDDGTPGGKKRKNGGSGKRRKVNHACVFCRRSHMTCDEGRPCQRWCVQQLALPAKPSHAHPDVNTPPA